MKKVISRMLAVSMLVSGMVMPVRAEEMYPDFVPNATIPENLFMTDQGANTSASRNFRAAAKKNPSTSIAFEAKGDWVNAAKNYASQLLSTSALVSKDDVYGYQGVIYESTSEYLASMEKFDPSKSYVISFDVKNSGGKDVSIGVALSNGSAATMSYAKDYGYEGMKVTSEEYMTFATAIKPAESFNPDATSVISIGFPKGTEAGASVTFDTSDINALYLAEEIPYDMINVLASEPFEVCQGGKFLMNAAVVNQVGTPGCLDRSMTWVAMDKDKTNEVEGFTFTQNPDGTTTVNVDESVPVGEYALVAISNTYDGYMKTAYINLNTKRITDSPLPGEPKPDNLILEPNGTGFYQSSTSSAIELSNGSDMCTVKAKTDISNANNMGLDGMKIRTTFNKGFASDFNFTAGKTYVVSAKVRKASSSISEDVKFQIGLGQKSEETLVLSDEYELTDDWTEIKAKITVPDDYDSSSSTKEFYLGMPDGTVAGSAFDIKLDVYIAEETLAGFLLSAEGNDDKLSVDDIVILNASISNQLGTPMSGYSQEFDWYILNEKRNEKVDVIKLNVNKDKNQATLNVDEFSENGIYFIVAEQETDEGIIRQSIEIEIEVPVLWEYVSTLISDEDDTRIGYNLSLYAKKLGIEKISGDDCDTSEVLKILFADCMERIESEEELVKQLKRAMALSLFNKNPKNVSLDVESEMAIEDIDKNDVTIAKLFNEYLSEEGKKDLRANLKDGEYVSFNDFIKPFAEQVILKTIEKPYVNGTSYVEYVLTEENATLAGIDVSKYFEIDDKSNINLKLARNSYTAETLMEELENYGEDEGSSGGGNSGGGGASGGGFFPSIKPAAGNVNIAPSQAQDDKAEENIVMFNDVSEKHWAYSDIYHLKQRKIISGDNNNNFKPDSTLTREQFVKMLCEAFGYSDGLSASVYADVDADAWYAPYVNAATNKKIVNGISNDRFGVGLPITRQDLCVIIYRAMGQTEDFSEELTFKDTELISDYAKAAVAYLAMYDVVNGFGDGNFNPKAYCTKAQAAKIMCKILSIKEVSE